MNLMKSFSSDQKEIIQKKKMEGLKNNVFFSRKFEKKENNL